jgi:hypothetical protein
MCDSKWVLESLYEQRSAFLDFLFIILMCL